MDDYGEECKKTHRLEEQLTATEAVLQCTKDALTTVKKQLTTLDATVVGNLSSPLLFSCPYSRSIPSYTISRLLFKRKPYFWIDWICIRCFDSVLKFISANLSIRLDLRSIVWLSGEIYNPQFCSFFNFDWIWVDIYHTPKFSILGCA